MEERAGPGAPPPRVRAPVRALVACADADDLPLNLLTAARAPAAEPLPRAPPPALSLSSAIDLSEPLGFLLLVFQIFGSAQYAFVQGRRRCHDQEGAGSAAGARRSREVGTRSVGGVNGGTMDSARGRQEGSRTAQRARWMGAMGRRARASLVRGRTPCPFFCVTLAHTPYFTPRATHIGYTSVDEDDKVSIDVPVAMWVSRRAHLPPVLARLTAVARDYTRARTGLRPLRPAQVLGQEARAAGAHPDPARRAEVPRRRRLVSPRAPSHPRVPHSPC